MSLNNVDYKIELKLVTRIQEVLYTIIHPDQKGSVPYSYTEENVIEIISIIDKLENGSMTHGLFSHWTQLIVISSQAFARSPTLAFSSVRENIYLNTKLELCWKMLLFIKLFYLILFLFYLILFYIIVVIVISICYW